jgi:hypothetical protein
MGRNSIAVTPGLIIFPSWGTKRKLSLRRETRLTMHLKFLLRLLSQGKISPRKIFNAIANIVQYHRRRMAPGTAPTVVELNMTNRCNIKCVTCRHTEEEIIPWADVEHPAEKRALSIAVGTMHPRLLEKITTDEAIHSVLLWKMYGSGE